MIRWRQQNGCPFCRTAANTSSVCGRSSGCLCATKISVVGTIYPGSNPCIKNRLADHVQVPDLTSKSNHPTGSRWPPDIAVSTGRNPSFITLPSIPTRPRRVCGSADHPIMHHLGPVIGGMRETSTTTCQARQSPDDRGLSGSGKHDVLTNQARTDARNPRASANLPYLSPTAADY
jgi:hypothetical protein